MSSNHTDRTVDTLLAAALMLLAFQAMWQLLDVLVRGRFILYGAALVAFTLLVLGGLVGQERPRPDPRTALLCVLVGLISLMAAWHLSPGTPRAEPSGRDIARLVLTRYLLVFEWSALFLAIAWQCRPPATLEIIDPADRSIPAFRLRPIAILVIVASLAAGAAFVMAGKRAGLGPVGPAAASLLFALGLATAAVCQRLDEHADA